jgi:phospholipase/carboxylesterase
MAFRVAVNHPGRFAGVVSLCGAFPGNFSPLRRLEDVRRLPVFLAVGRDSSQYSPAQACNDLRLFHTAGISVALRQYPCRHELAPQMLRDLDRWIIEQITQRADTPAESDNPWRCPSE